ncbi:MAG: hypothetical protein AAF615_02355 [Pseudomonadota bacterium]
MAITSSGNTITVEANGTGDFTTIQAAIDAAADGDTIVVGSGTFTEQLLIEGFTDLTITGAGDSTIIAMPASPQFNITSGDGGGRDRAAVVTVEDSTNVCIENVLVDGGNQADLMPPGTNPDFEGVLFFDSSGIVDDVTFAGIGDPLQSDGTPSTEQRGNAIAVINTDSNARTVELSDNTIEGFQKTGIIAEGTGLTLDINGNTITGAGFLESATAIAQNGIQVTGGAGGSVTGNTIEEIGYRRGDFFTTGILAVEAADGFTVTGNTFIGATDSTSTTQATTHFGVFISGETNNAVVTGNTFDGLTFGLLGEFDVDGFVGQPNTFTDMFAEVVTNTGDGTLEGRALEYLGDNNDEGLVAFQGTSGNDFLSDTAFDDELAGGAGDDTFFANAGNDVYEGDDGTDVLDISFATQGAFVRLDQSFAFGGSATGFDTITGIEDVIGSEGADFIFGDANDNTIFLSEGRDTLAGKGGNDDAVDGSLLATGVDIDLAAGTAVVDGVTQTLQTFENATGSDFADNIIGSTAINNLAGGAGNDVIIGGVGNDIIDGGEGNDTIQSAFATDGRDTLLDAAGTDTLELTDRDALDVVGRRSGTSLVIEDEASTGTNARVLITNHYTTNQLEVIEFSDGTSFNVLQSGTTGDNNANYMVDSSASSTINAFGSADVVFGGGGADTISGGDGNDSITGGTGRDFMTGDAGEDVFVYRAEDETGNNGSTADQITDFTVDTDLMDLEELGVDTFLGTGQPFTGAGGEVLALQVGTLALLQVDLDGSGTSDMWIILQNVTAADLDSDDFILA